MKRLITTTACALIAGSAAVYAASASQTKLTAPTEAAIQLPPAAVEADAGRHGPVAESTLFAPMDPITDTKTVDLVLALDVSGSMSGLIDSARQRLWDIVNVMGSAEPRPTLRVAVLSYGNPGYGAHTGYVRIDQPFTTNLDQVSEVLFSYGTSGGTEYVARAIDTAVRQLDWTGGGDNLRILFVAGNEAATQDPQITLDVASGLASQHNIVVNTLFCGDMDHGAQIGWDRAANLTDGMYASIDQHAAAVAQIETPMDQEIARLNESLNETYVAFGDDADEAVGNQLRQDANAAAMSLSSAVSRTITKAGDLYRSAWDLVDALDDGTDIASIDASELPEEMQAMSPEARVEHVRKKADARVAIRDEITALAKERERYIAERKAELETDATGLDTAITEALTRGGRERHPDREPVARFLVATRHVGPRRAAIWCRAPLCCPMLQHAVTRTARPASPAAAATATDGTGIRLRSNTRPTDSSGEKEQPATRSGARRAALSFPPDNAG